MAKFVVVKEAPAELRKGEYIIAQPNFMEEVVANKGKRPNTGLTGPAYIRSICGMVGERYDNTLTAWNIRPHLYDGRPFKTDQDMSEIIVDLLKTQHPSVFEGYINHKIRTRPIGTKVIYYVGDFTTTKPFFDNGIDQIEYKDVEVELGLKAKKVIGKPAITNEDAHGNT
jgi:hypothetical protein